MKAFLVVSVLAVLLCSVFSTVTRYDNNPLLKLNITSLAQRDYLASWIEKINLPASIPAPDMPPIDIWTYESSIQMGTNDIHVDRAYVERFQSLLTELSISYSVAHSNVQELIDNQHDIPESQQSTWFDVYHGTDAIVLEIRNLCASKPSLCTYYEKIATSVEGRAIVGVRLSGEQVDNDAPTVWIQGGQHAREWVGPATVMYLLNQFITLYGSNPSITSILDKVNIYIVPLVNPDGYSWTWTNTRLWRKNRRVNSDRTLGVDLNRNWADHWGGPGSSGTPSSDTYRGTAPFSEPESSGISKFMSAVASNSIVSIDYHSYSQLILRPFSWGTTQPSNDAAQRAAGAAMASAIINTPGVPYSNIAGYELYVASGGAHDWFYSMNGATYSYTIELRDTGTYGFTLPASQILPTARENWNALVGLIKTACKCG